LGGRSPAAQEVRILGQKHRVRAKIVQMGGFSATLTEMNSEMAVRLSEAPSKLFVTHGEPQTALSFADLVSSTKKWTVSVPRYQDSVVLS